MAAFHEVLFPPLISYGSSGGGRMRTSVFTAGSGYEIRKKIWTYPKAEYDVSKGIQDQADMDDVIAFFYARRGRAYGFRYKDWNDFKFTFQRIAFGDGVKTDFQIIKTYTSTQAESSTTITYDRRLTKIAWDTIAGVTIDDVVNTDWEVDHNTGIISFDTAPAADAEIVIGVGEFHVPVRFDTDHLDMTHEFWNTLSSQIPLVEVRDWTEVYVVEEAP